MQRVVTGRAFSRPAEMALPQLSHTPYVPCSSRVRAASILVARRRSRSPRRSAQLRSLSTVPRSFGSGISSASRDTIARTVSSPWPRSSASWCWRSDRYWTNSRLRIVHLRSRNHPQTIAPAPAWAKPARWRYRPLSCGDRGGRYPRAVRSKTIVLLAVSMLPPLVATAQSVAPGGVAELAGPRTIGIGAALGIASGNDAVYVNPGALAARRRYSAEAQSWFERRGAETTAQVWTASVADSLSSSVAAAAAYGRVTEGIETGSLYHLALERPVSAATVDAGILWQVADYVSLGVAGYNLAPTSQEVELPRGVGAGIGVGSDRSVQGTFDWRADLDRRGKTTNRYAFGAEVLLGDVAPLRASYVIDETLDTRWWSIGAGLVSGNGGGVDVAYRQSVDDPNARVIAVAVKLQF